MVKGSSQPPCKKKVAAASSATDEDDEALVRRKAREAEKKLNDFARERHLQTVARCQFQQCVASGGGQGKQVVFAWTMERPSDKQHHFIGEHPRLTAPIILTILRRLQRSVPEIVEATLQLQWEQFLCPVATGASERATVKYGMVVDCEYVGAATESHHGRKGGRQTYEPNPSKWSATACERGRQTETRIFFKFTSELPAGKLSVFHHPVRIDNLKDGQLSLPSRARIESVSCRALHGAYRD